MGAYDTFYIHEGFEVQVKCFDTIGGTMDEYNIGDIVPMRMIDTDFNTVKDYGRNFNIFPYQSEGYVILIRDGIYTDCLVYDGLLLDNVKGIKCIDKYGNELNINTPKEYRELFVEKKSIKKDHIQT